MEDPDRTQRLRRALLARIHRRHQTRRVEVELGGRTLVFERIADPDRVLDEVAREEDRLEKLDGTRRRADLLRLPYWAELWDSSVGLARHLHARGLVRPGLAVLDLGCGMGLAGCAAAAAGGQVLFADIETEALLFAALNSLAWRGSVRTRRLNWRTDRLAERFDLILGADILYEKEQWPWLESFWAVHLAEGGRVLLGEPMRPSGESFLEWIGARPWDVAVSAEKTPGRPVRVIEMTRIVGRAN